MTMTPAELAQLREQSMRVVHSSLLNDPAAIESYDLLKKIGAIHEDVTIEDWLHQKMAKSTWADEKRIKHDTACEIKNQIGNAVYRTITGDV